ncbi:probable L-type lectin-domain containing receptor kinase S.5 [Triticum dicoccoides]|uniref:probable L-type lectin-domain containing receptor kinase S.5 n=1 Tax=Triticum dicoccoides TaxID=85692 RepID=UPI0018902D14|nr:probable L-type lectin-domain containing receptor kinase S.5 [Triticum dicoccoides]
MGSAVQDRLWSGIGAGLPAPREQQRVLHRDIKPSNVMLDMDYNARLGDFGLARVIQHDGVTHHSTQAVAGTRGYMAHECFFTGRASLDTDVYAFGVFIIEVVSGKSPSSGVKYIHDSDQVGKEDYSSGGLGRHPLTVHIVDWTWSLYGEGMALHAADPLLDGGFEQAQVDCAVRLALACCHPNPREAVHEDGGAGVDRRCPGTGAAG